MSQKTQAAQFAKRFFGDGNEFQWKDVCPGAGTDAANRMQAYLAPLLNNEDYVVLPRRMQDSRVVWYGIARTSVAARNMRSELAAAIGWGYSSFRGDVGTSAEGDGVEEAIEEFAPGRWFRILLASDRESVNATRVAVRRYLALHRDKPNTRSASHRSASEILRDFELALASGGEDRIDDLLREVRLSARLSNDNVLHLEIIAKATFGRREAVLTLVGIRDICARRRPRRVTKALIEAVYAQQLERFEASDDPAGAVEHFKEHLYPTIGGLWRSVRGLDGPAVRKTFMLCAVLGVGGGMAVEDILSRSGVDSTEEAYLRRIAALVGSVPRLTGRDAGGLEVPAGIKAKDAYFAGDLQGALEYASAAEPTLEVLSIALHAAANIGSHEAAENALLSVSKADDSTILALRARPGDAATLARLEERATADVQCPTSWTQWFESLSDGLWEGVEAVLQEDSERWELFPAGHSVGTWAGELGSLIVGASCHDTLDVRRLAVGILTRRILAISVPPDSGPLLEAIFDYLTYDGVPSVDVLDTMARIASHRCIQGCSSDTYSELVESIVHVWHAVESAHALWSVLEVIDLLIEVPCPDCEARLRLVQAVVTSFGKPAVRARDDHCALLARFCEELDCPLSVEPPVVEPVDGAASLTSLCEDRRIDIYSLQERAVRRVKAFLENTCAGCQVHLHHDKKGGSPELRHAARHTDCFVIVTAAGTHSATTFIEDSIGQGVPIVRVHATGLTSILRSIEHGLGVPKMT